MTIGSPKYKKNLDKESKTMLDKKNKLSCQKDRKDKNESDKNVSDCIKTNKSPVVRGKVKSLINALEENVVVRENKTPIMRDVEKLAVMKGEVVKDAFRIMLESSRGESIPSNSPGRKQRKRIGSLKSRGKQQKIEEWFRKK